MKLMFKFLVLFILFALCLESTCDACPMCKTATETAGNESQPAAYMASILTMLAMPTTLFTVVGISLFRLNRRENEELEQMQYSEPTSSTDADNKPEYH